MPDSGWPTVDTPTERRIKSEWRTVPDDPPQEETVATVEIPAALEQHDVALSDSR